MAAIPNFREFYIPVLKALEDGDIHSIKEIREKTAEALDLSDEDKAEMLGSGNQTAFSSRLGRANAYLKKAGLIEAHGRGRYAVTQEGRKFLKSGGVVTDELLLKIYPKFAKSRYLASDRAKAGKGIDGAQIVQPASLKTGNDEAALEARGSVKGIESRRNAALRAEIMDLTPAAFEELVMELLQAIGYGADKKSLKRSGGIIDGVLYEDTSCFNLIYVHAEKRHPGVSVSKAELQAFYAAMTGLPRITKGLYITTAEFPQDARAFAEQKHIDLVGGRKLAQLIKEHGLDVTEHDL